MDRSVVFHCNSSGAKKALAKVLVSRGESVCPVMAAGDSHFSFIVFDEEDSRWNSYHSPKWANGRTIVEVG